MRIVNEETGIVLESDGDQWKPVLIHNPETGEMARLKHDGKSFQWESLGKSGEISNPQPLGFLDSFNQEKDAIVDEYHHAAGHPLDTAKSIGNSFATMFDHPKEAIGALGDMASEAVNNPAGTAGVLAAQPINPISWASLGAGSVAARTAAKVASRTAATVAGAATGATTAAGLNVADTGARAASEGREVQPGESGAAAILGAGLGSVFSVPVARMASKGALKPKPEVTVDKYADVNESDSPLLGLPEPVHTITPEGVVVPNDAVPVGDSLGSGEVTNAIHGRATPVDVSMKLNNPESAQANPILGLPAPVHKVTPDGTVIPNDAKPADPSLGSSESANAVHGRAEVPAPVEYAKTKTGNIRTFKKQETAQKIANGKDVVPHPEKKGMFAIVEPKQESPIEVKPEAAVVPKEVVEAPQPKAEVKVEPVKPEIKQEPVVEKPPKPIKKQEDVKPKPVSPEAKIEDFGEKIGGAAKDTYIRALDNAGGLDVRSVPFAKAFPEPNYKKLTQAGANKKLLALARAVRESVSDKPRGRYARTAMMNKYENELVKARAHVASYIKMAASNVDFGEIKDSSSLNIANKAALYEAVGHEKSLKGFDLGHRVYSLYKGEKNVSFWSVETARKSTAFGNIPREVAHADTREAAIEQFKKWYIEQEAKPKEAKRTKFDIYKMRYTGKAGIGKNVGRNQYFFREDFENAKEAREYLNEHYNEIESHFKAWKEIPAHRNATNRERKGVDHRKGKDVTPEMFTDTFGFRGVEFGNWVSKKGERQGHLNRAYDALSDLAVLLNIPTQAISLNGELGLAFGARGKKGAAAHYERDKVVINLTRKQGAGSLAHEWWHALDNYISRNRNHGSGFLSEKPYKLHNDSTRPELIAAFKELQTAIHKTGLRERSAKLDTRKAKEYWGTGREMSARSFESYVISSLEDGGFSNDYLANIVSEKAFELENEYPYIKASEIDSIKAGFDNLFKTIKTEKTDKGTRLYSKGDTSKGITAEQAKQSLTKTFGSAVKRAIKKGKVVIHQTAKDVPDGVKRSVDVQTNTKAFKKWAGSDRDVIESDEVNDFDFSAKGPFVLRAYHGTTHDLDYFDASINGTKEGQFGAVNYFTSSKYDAEQNYAGEGPDLTQRIILRAERLEQELEDSSPSEMKAALIGAGITDKVADRILSNTNNSPAAVAKHIANEELHGGREQVLDVYIRTEKPFVVGEGSPWLEFMDESTLEDDAIEAVATDEGVSVEDVKENLDDYEDQIDEMRWQLRDELDNDLVNAIETVSEKNDIDPKDILDEMYDYMADGEIKHKTLEELLRKNEAIAYAEDQETGNLSGFHVLGEIIQELGFDSIILKDANTRFENMNMEHGTAHIHVFDADNTNIKSATDNVGTFDRNDKRIRYAKDGKVQGWTDPDGTVHIIAGNNTDATLASTMLHESLHSFFSGNNKAKAKAVTQIKNLRIRKSAKEWLDKADESAREAGTAEKDIDEEALAYAITHYEQAVGAIKRVVDRFISEIKAYLVRKFGADMKITPSTLRAMARQHIKSLGESAETFNSEGTIRFSRAAKASTQKDLYVSHNLTAENLTHAEKMGGIAVPSLAVNRVGTGALTGFGEISLVAGSDMIDNKTAKTFNADVYSPRYPSVEREVSYKEYNSIFSAVNDLAKKYGFTKIDMDAIQRNETYRVVDSESMKLAYLNEKGKAPRVRFTQDKVHPALRKFIGKDAHDLIHDEVLSKQFKDAVQKEHDDNIQSLIDNNGISRDEAVHIMNKSPSARRIVNMAHDMRYKKVGKFADKSANREAVEKRFNAMSKKAKEDYDSWAKSKIEAVTDQEQIFDGFTNSGNRKYLAHNLDNVVRIMKRKLRDGEGFNYGIGSIRSTVANQFKSVAQIKKARNDIISTEDFDAVKTEIETEYEGLKAELEPYDTVFSGDIFDDSLKELATNGVSSFKDFYPNLPDSVKHNVVSFLSKLRNMPTEYFETKMQRAVGLHEFSGAAVPADASKATLELLKKEGIDVVKYKPNDEASREQAISRLAKRRNLLFSKGGNSKGITAEQAKQSLTKTFGSAVKRAIQKGNIVIHDTEKDVPKGVKRMVAWHGSPHDHNKFSTKHIGTGEGAQAYGYGLYFAGNREIAEWYRDNLSSRVGTNPTKTLFDGKTLMDWYSHWEKKANRSRNPAEFYDRMSMLEETELSWNANAALKIAKDDGLSTNAIAWFKDVIASKFERPGKTYKVELAPKEDEYLLWDKPFSEQSDKVKNLLEKITNEYAVKVVNDIGVKDFQRDTAIKAWQSRFEGRDLYAHLEVVQGGDKAASSYLHSLGIRGIKYLDGSSRGKGEGDYNYVIFDDADVSITAKYAKDGAVQGWTDPDGTVHIIAENNTKETLASTMLHESLHSFFAGDNKAKSKAVAQIKKLRGSKFAKAWLDKADEAARAADTPVKDFDEEALAYAVTHYEQAVGAIKRVVDRFISEVKAYLIRKFGADLKITPSTLRAMARQNLGEIGNRNFSPARDTVLRSIAKEYGITVKEAKTQYNAVVSKYKDTDQWMKAPNGKPTNLNERQWVQVRTPAFKKWFGDWENNAANASNVVDGNGEPMVVYHFTDKEFEQFDISKADGFWFTTKSKSDGSGSNGDSIRKDVFINARNVDVGEAPSYDLETAFKDSDSDAMTEIYEDDNGEQVINYVVINPLQIKSAIDNTGQFSDATKDIRYSKAQTITSTNIKRAIKLSKAFDEYKTNAKSAVEGGAKGAAEVSSAIGRAFYTRPVQQIRNIGTDAAKKIGDLVYKEERHEKRAVKGKDLIQRRSQKEGEYGQRLTSILDSISGRFGVRKADSEALVAGLNHPKGRITKRLSGQFDEARKLLDDIRDYMRDAGVDVGYIKNYFPRVYDTRKLLLHKSGFIRLLNKHGIKDGESVYRRIVENDGFLVHSGDSNRVEVNQYGERRTMHEGKAAETSMEKERKLDIPYDELKQFLVNDYGAIMARYVHHATRRAEFARTFGDNEQVLNKLADQVVEDYANGKANGKMDVRTALNVIYGLADDLQGRGMRFDSEGLNSISRGISNVSIMIYLPLVAMASFSEFAAPALKGGLRHYPKAFVKGVTDGLVEATAAADKLVTGKRHIGKTEWRKSAELMGSVSQHAINEVWQRRFGGATSKATSKFMRATMLEQMTNIQKIIASEMGKAIIKDISGKNSKQAIMDMKDFGLEPGKKPTDEEIEFAAQRFAQQVITDPNEATTPRLLTHPGANLIFQFKRFITVFSSTLLKSVLQNIARSPSLAGKTRFIVPSIAMVAIAYYTQYLRDQVKYGDSEPPFRKRTETKKRWMDAVDRAGLTGDLSTLYMLANPYRYGFTDNTESRLFNLMGAPIGAVAKATDIVTGAGSSKADKRAKAITNLIPVVNAIAPLRKATQKKIRNAIR